jgi:hypothetical protein
MGFQTDKSRSLVSWDGVINHDPTPPTSQRPSSTG